MAGGFAIKNTISRNLSRIAREFPTYLGAALFDEMGIEAEECRERTPVDTGLLQSTVRAVGWVITANRIEAGVAAGGPGVEYAVKVHEDLDAFHRVGEAKFIERPLLESAPYLAQRIASRIHLQELM